ISIGCPGLACLVAFFALFPWDLGGVPAVRFAVRLTAALAAAVVALRLALVVPVLDGAPLRVQALALRSAQSLEVVLYGGTALFTLILVALQTRLYREGRI